MATTEIHVLLIDDDNDRPISLYEL